MIVGAIPKRASVHGVKEIARVEFHGCDLFTFRDRKIALKNSYRKNRPPLAPEKG